MKLFFVLLASFSCQYIVESELISSLTASHGYDFYGIVWSLIYLLPAMIATGLASEAKLNKQTKNVVLYSLLGFCMAFSATLTLLMTNFGMYYSLLTFSTEYWVNIYRAIEIIILIMVGRDGFIHMVNSTSFNYYMRKVDIFVNLKRPKGKQQ